MIAASADALRKHKKIVRLNSWGGEPGSKRNANPD